MSEPSLADVVHEAVEKARADDEARRPVTLSEFLLARISEDEERARYETPHWADCEHFIMFSEGGLPCTLGCEERLLAECEAKRRIVEHAKSATNGHVKLTAVQHCTWLAQPYVEHPDFDPAWRL